MVLGELRISIWLEGESYSEGQLEETGVRLLPDCRQGMYVSFPEGAEEGSNFIYSPMALLFSHICNFLI